MSRQALSTRVDELLEERLRVGERFFEGEADRIARLCRRLADGFLSGGRLLAVGGTPQSWSDAHHVAVEFVHPVIVGKRALPALAVSADALAGIRRPEDTVITFEPLTIADECFDPPSGDPYVCQEVGETLYHVLWELVHVFFEHRGTSGSGAGASGFLYPFLEGGREDADEVVADVARSVLAKSREVGELRLQTLCEGADELEAAARAIRESSEAGGTVLAFGNGGSATDAQDAVADFRAAPQGWLGRRAIDLTADGAILTALANDIGPGVLFARQVIAYGREGDVVLAISTSGGSQNVVEALVEARRRGLVTVALLGYDGGRIADEGLADHLVVTRSEHIPRIQEAQASAYHVLRELVELVA